MLKAIAERKCHLRNRSTAGRREPQSAGDFDEDLCFQFVLDYIEGREVVEDTDDNSLRLPGRR